MPTRRATLFNLLAIGVLLGLAGTVGVVVGQQHEAALAGAVEARPRAGLPGPPGRVPGQPAASA